MVCFKIISNRDKGSQSFYKYTSKIEYKYTLVKLRCISFGAIISKKDMIIKFLCYIDTDSFTINIETNNGYKDISKDVEERVLILQIMKLEYLLQHTKTKMLLVW